MRFVTVCHELFIEPRAIEEDDRRRECIINVLLCGLAALALIFLLFSVLHALDLQVDQAEDLALMYGVFLAAVVGLLSASRYGYPELASYGLLGLLLLSALKLTLHWSFELPLCELLYAIIIVFAGILLTRRAAFVVSVCTGVTLLVISYAQVTHRLMPRLDWVQQDFRLGDAVGYIGLLALIGAVSWLTTRDLEHSLERVRRSEVALMQERDNLEDKIRERSQELEHEHQLRIVELSRFAEFGRVSAQLFHEITNPLTAATLHLDQLESQPLPLVHQARQSLHQMERYVMAARRQLNQEVKSIVFSISEELALIQHVMAPMAHQASVEIIISSRKQVQLYGDPIKFSQLVTNLVSNAIEAYEAMPVPPVNKRVTITCRHRNGWVTLEVFDNGMGIESAQLPLLFEPFYTTKQRSSHSELRSGNGIGLAIAKRIAEEDFGGGIGVESVPVKGTKFTVRLRNQPQEPE